MLYKKLRNSDGTYGPTVKKNFYQPNPLHGIHSTNAKKTKWCISEDKEFSVFELAEKDENNLFCHENDCYFSILDNGRIVLGQNDERLAKFPLPQNLTDSWHGYPVFCDQTHNIPRDTLLDVMVKKDVINKTTRRRIERKKI